MSIDLEELAAIIEQLDQTEFTDFFYQNGDLQIRVSRGGSFTDARPHQSTSDSNSAERSPHLARTPPAASPPTVPTPTASSHSTIDTENLPAGHTVVAAPMLGTFYAAPKPGEAPFVSLGDIVAADSVVSIIEVMKLMNSVAAGVSGEIVEVLVEDGELVEHGQPLFLIKES